MAGKSTVRARLFGEMKASHFNVDEIQEVAKIVKSSGQSWRLLQDQLGIFAQQNTLQQISKKEGFEYAISDSPLLLSGFYAPGDYLDSLQSCLLEVFNSYSNFNYFIERDFSCTDVIEFSQGRAHSLEFSKGNQENLKTYLLDLGVPLKIVPLSHTTHLEILEDIIRTR